jgi:hypothetical protein
MRSDLGPETDPKSLGLHFHTVAHQMGKSASQESYQESYLGHFILEDKYGPTEGELSCLEVLLMKLMTQV